MKKSFIHAAKYAAMFAITLSLFVGCNNSTSAEEEQEPVGIRVKLNNALVAEQLANGTVQGTINITQSQSNTYQVLFVDDAGEEFTPELEEHSLEAVSSNANVSVTAVNFSQAPFTVSLTGSAHGSAELTLTMLHVGEAEFISRPITVNVAGQQ